MHQQTESNIINLLGQICRLEHARSHELLEELGLYRGQHRILCALWEQDGLTHTELSEYSHVRPATISTTIQRMEAVGLVARKHDAEDQRVSRVYLTKTGRALQQDVEQVWHKIEGEVFVDVTPEERMLLRRIFIQMRENLMRVTQQKPYPRSH
ncbi:MAG: MarR family transcriptional regulator [Anaerolineae bacterium]|nr:MarR family transcriptional regulator [Anaerolineae bacterium]